MKGLRLATAAILMAVPSGAIIVTPGALARSHPVHHRHHHARHHNKAHTVSFYARVVRASAHGLVVRTLNGKRLTFSSKQLRHRDHAGVARLAAQGGSPQVVVNILGLQPGVLVQITESTDANGNLTITITLTSQTGAEQATGVLTEVDSDAFMVTTGDGTTLRLHMAADALSNLDLQSCNTVDVTYHQDAGMLIADSVNITGSSSSGDCAPTHDASGTISAVWRRTASRSAPIKGR